MSYYDETATLRVLEGRNAGGDATYSDATIELRYEDITAEYARSFGENINGKGRFFTDSEVKVGDVLLYDDVEYPVQAVKARRIGGELFYTEAIL